MPASPDAVARLAAVVRERTGLDLAGHRRDDLLRAAAQLEPAHGPMERLCEAPPFDELIRLLTVGETSFFRHAEQFELFTSRILPTLIDRRRAEGSLRLHLWSAGCATGEEAHSIALALAHSLSDRPSWSITLRGTDINPHFLAAAREASYGEWSFRGSPPWIRDHFTPKAKRWQLDEEVRKLAAFAQLNLAADDYPHDVDVIFCRNVLIYFDAEVRARVLMRLREALAPDGWLIVGHADLGADTVDGLEPAFETESFIYRRAPIALPLTPTPAAVAAPRRVRRPPARRRASRQEQEPDAQTLFEAAARCFDRGEDDAAADALRRSLYLDSRQPAAHYLAGLIAVHRGNNRGAARHFRAAMVTLSTLAAEDVVRGTEGITAGRMRSVLGALLHETTEETLHA